MQHNKGYIYFDMCVFIEKDVISWEVTTLY